MYNIIFNYCSEHIIVTVQTVFMDKLNITDYEILKLRYFIFLCVLVTDKMAI